MKINSITPVSFVQKAQPTEKIWQPHTYRVDGTTVTLSAEEEQLYKTSISQTLKTVRNWSLGCAGAGLGFGALRGNRNLMIFGPIIGAAAGALFGVVDALVTGKTKYNRLPYDKIELENGLARQNLATMNNKEVKNEN